MLEFIKKGILVGIGAAVVTKEKIQEATRNLVKEGKISTDEAEKLADDLLKSGEREVDEMSSKISEAMKRWTDNFEVVRKKEFQELNARLEVLEQKVTSLESARKKEQGELDP
jgi:polyhydroxyalkanoate synthesis regulator phasin